MTQPEIDAIDNILTLCQDEIVIKIKNIRIVKGADNKGKNNKRLGHWVQQIRSKIII